MYVLFLYLTIITLIVLIIVLRFYFLNKIRDKDVEIEILSSEVNKLNQKDPLTNIYNRLYFDKNYIKEFHRARRVKQPLGILCVDLDDLKKINIEEGKSVGDSIIKDIAKILNKVIQRDTDFVVRYNSDEFIAILYNTDSNGVELVLERIISNLDIKTPKGKPVYISAGVHVGIPDNHTNSEMMLNEAVKALLKAKKQLGNSIEFSLNSI